MDKKIITVVSQQLAGELLIFNWKYGGSFPSLVFGQDIDSTDQTNESAGEP